MESIKIRLAAPIELGYFDDTIELDIYYLPAGIVNILHEGKASDLDVVEIIKENYADILNVVMNEQIRLAWELREKPWDTPEEKYGEIEHYLNNMNNIRRQTAG